MCVCVCVSHVVCHSLSSLPPLLSSPLTPPLAPPAAPWWRSPPEPCRGCSGSLGSLESPCTSSPWRSQPPLRSCASTSKYQYVWILSPTPTRSLPSLHCTSSQILFLVLSYDPLSSCPPHVEILLRYRSIRTVRFNRVLLHICSLLDAILRHCSGLLINSIYIIFWTFHTFGGITMLKEIQMQAKSVFFWGGE